MKTGFKQVAVAAATFATLATPALSDSFIKGTDWPRGALRTNAQIKNDGGQLAIEAVRDNIDGDIEGTPENGMLMIVDGHKYTPDSKCPIIQVDRFNDLSQKEVLTFRHDKQPDGSVKLVEMSDLIIKPATRRDTRQANRNGCFVMQLTSR